MVKGDLIVPTSDRIMTRSRAKQSMSMSNHALPRATLAWSSFNTSSDPDQFTIIPAPLKILKVLVDELASASGMQSAATAAAAAAAQFVDDDEDDGWEDEPDTIDLSLGTTKSDLMSYLDASNMRNRDDETQHYLAEFFVRAASENIADFNNWYGGFTDDEKSKLQSLAHAQAQ